MDTSDTVCTKYEKDLKDYQKANTNVMVDLIL